MLPIIGALLGMGVSMVVLAIVVVAVLLFIFYKFGMAIFKNKYGVMTIGAVIIAVLLLSNFGMLGNNIGTNNQFVYGIYDDGTYELLGSSKDGILNKSMFIYDESGRKLKGFCFLAFADFEKPLSEYKIDEIYYNYHVDKVTGTYNKRVYERPWVSNSQFVKDAGFTSGPPDGIGINGVTVKDGYYFWKITPSGSDTVVPLGDRLNPSRPYPISYGEKTAYPIVFWIDTSMAEQSYSCQLGIPADNSLQTYKVTLNMVLMNSSLAGLQGGTINPNNSAFTTTFKLRRDLWNETVDFQIIWASPYIYQ